jgi:integrase
MLSNYPLLPSWTTIYLLTTIKSRTNFTKTFYLREETRRLLNIALSNQPLSLPVIYLGAEHGASKQEILSLKWHDVQFDNGTDGLIRFFRTKNGKERTEFIMPRTSRALMDWKSHLEYKRHRMKIRDVKSDNVFCKIDGTPIRSFSRGWWAALKVEGISGFHFHDLRHTFCSNLLMAGGDLKDAKEMIGHSDIAMTDRYSHLSGLHKRNLQKQLAEYYKTGLAK